MHAAFARISPGPATASRDHQTTDIGWYRKRHTMSLQQLAQKPNARSHLEKLNEQTVIVLFDPKTAYEHLVDQRKTLQKGYVDIDLQAVDHDRAIEDAEDEVPRTEDRKA